MRVLRSSLSLLVPLSVVAAMVAPATSARAVAPPSVTIDYPTAAYIPSTSIEIYATGSVDPSETDDPPSTLSLVVDGDVAHPVDYHFCQTVLSPTSCQVQLGWPGPLTVGDHHTFQVIMATVHGRTAASPVRQVTVINALPTTVKVTAPHVVPGQTGTVPVTATGAVDPTYGDRPRLMVLFHGGFQDPSPTEVDCPAVPQATTCTEVFRVDAQTVANQGYFVLFGSFQVPNTEAGAAPVVTMTAPSTGSVVTGTTHVTATASIDTSWGDSAQSLTLLVDGHPTGGSVPCSTPPEPYQTQKCDVDFAWDPSGLAAGSHTVAVRVTTTQTEGTSNASTVTVGGTRPTVAITCTVPTDVNHGTPVTITCHADKLAWHSVLALRITGSAIPHEVLFGKTDIHGNVSFPETFLHPGQQLSVRATTADTRLYAASSSPAYPLHVH